MTAQHLTTPHTADQIEHTHTVESSEGHQVPGPPHSHGHDHHHAPDTGPVVAVIVLAVLLLGAAWIGLRAPELHEGHVAPRPVDAGEAAEGVVVLDDGRVFPGTVTVQPKTITVRSDEHGEVVLPADRVRWRRTGGTTLTDEYWQQFGHLPVEATPASRGGGIVVIDTGEVFVGRVIEDAAGGLTIRWANGGAVTIPRERVRWWRADRETLSEDYWQQHADEPLDPRWQRGDKGQPVEDRRGSQRPSAGSRDKRANALLAQSGGRWAEATLAWAELYHEKQLPTDLTNLLSCAERWFLAGFDMIPPAPNTERLRAILEPFAHVPVVRKKLDDFYFDTARHHIVGHEVEKARRWATALQAIGDAQGRAPWLLQAAAEVERHMEEEQQEHHDDDEHGH